MSMHIAGLEINYPHRAVEIYVSGCTRACPGCHNPELQRYGVGKKWQRWLRDNTHRLHDEYSQLTDRIWVMGGDLLCQQPEDAVEFLRALRNASGPAVPVWVWTGEDDAGAIDPDILNLADVWKLGAYREDLPSHDILIPASGRHDRPARLTLASSNQRLFFTRR